MRVNRGKADGRPFDQGDGAAGVVAPTGSSGTQGSRTDRANKNDEDVGSSASRESAADLDPTAETPDVTGTTDALES
jgi:hypothetical protein